MKKWQRIGCGVSVWLVSIMTGLAFAQDVPVVNAYAITPDQSNSGQAVSLESQVAQLQRQVNAMGQMDFLGQINRLQQEIQQLRGQLEVTSHQMKQLQQLQRSMYSDLDQRLSQLSSVKQPGVSAATPLNSATAPGLPNGSGVAAISPATSLATGTTNSAASAAPVVNNGGVTQFTEATPTIAPKTAVASESTAQLSAKTSTLLQEQDMYQQAYQQIQNSNYTGAIAAMQNYLKTYPQGEYAANANYWLGELYLVEGSRTKAEQAFQTVITQYPQNAKVADAMLKLGFVYADAGQYEKARTTLAKIPKLYPETSVARLATSRLLQLKQQGH